MRINDNIVVMRLDDKRIMIADEPARQAIIVHREDVQGLITALEYFLERSKA